MSRRIAVPLLLLVAFALPAAADEIVYFANGTTMAIRSHKVDGEMIRVDLGAGAIMAFPISMVERVMVGGRDVFTGPSYRPSNQALPGQEGSTPPVEVTRDTTITGEGSLPARYRSDQAESRIRTGEGDSYDSAVTPRSSPTPQSRFKRAAARQLRLREQPIGTAQIGDGLALQTAPPGVPRPTVATFGRTDQPSAAPPPPGEQPPADAPAEPGDEPPPESN